MEKLIQSYDKALMRNARFALSNIITSLSKIINVLSDAQQAAIDVIPASAVTDKSLIDRHVFGPQPRKTSHPQLPTEFTIAKTQLLENLSKIQRQIPLFLGDIEIQSFISSIESYLIKVNDTVPIAFVDPDLKDIECIEKNLHKKLGDLLVILKQVTEDSMITCIQLTIKRDLFHEFLENTVKFTTHSQERKLNTAQKEQENRLFQLQRVYNDPIFAHHKQLLGAIQYLEDYMSSMIAPHLEICHTINLANAKVPYQQNSEFTGDDCKEIAKFVDTAIQLKALEVNIKTVLEDPDQFVHQLKLFEKAAKKDAFLVVTSALKLQFQECLDEELFLAYITDWKDKSNELRTLESSTTYLRAIRFATEIKSNIISEEEKINKVKTKVHSLDDPVRTTLCFEIMKLIEDENESSDDYLKDIINFLGV